MVELVDLVEAAVELAPLVDLVELAVTDAY
jgi:hypothetical protein